MCGIESATRARAESLRPAFLFPDKSSLLQLAKRLLEFRLRVHHDRPAPGNGLLDRLARNKQEPAALVARLDTNRITLIEQYE